MSLLIKWLLCAFQIGRLAGIPIKVHCTLPLFLLAGAWLTGSLFDAGLLLLIVAFMLTCITLHEMGHALVAMRKGCYTVDILLTPIGGIARILTMPLDAKDETQVAIAGPLVSLCLALIFLLPATLSYLFGYDIAGMVFATICIANLIFFIFNLIPAFPMDGGRILRARLSLKKGRLEATRIACLLGRGIAILFFIAGWIIPHWLLMPIAVFVYFVAGLEYKRMVRHAGPRPGNDPYRTPLLDHDTFVVGDTPCASPHPGNPYHLGKEILSAIRILKEECPRLFQPGNRVIDPR
ncbi:MAG: site-2 protease family protein [Verrucomicrobiota bacterium]